MPDLLTCDGCGLCCAVQGLPPGYTVAALMTHLPAELRDEVLGHLAEERRTRQTRHERRLPCIWYDEASKGCRQYEHRPPACRKLEIGSSGCNQWRAAGGLPVFVIHHPEPAVYSPSTPPDAAAPDAEGSLASPPSVPYSPGVVEAGELDRRQQAAILRAAALRLDGGEPALPTDVFAPVARELEQRDDEAAIAAAWDEQGDKEGEPWVYIRGQARG
jgi:uncharacterized protein